MSYQNHELPSPAQLHKLAGIGVTFAQEQDRLRASREKPKAYGFLPKEIETINITEESHSETYHKITGRIGKIAFRQWRLHLREAYWVTGEESTHGSITTYSFEWNDKKALRAERETHVANQQEQSFEDLVEQVIDYGFSEEPDFLNARNQYKVVTAEDCDLLISSIASFREDSRTLTGLDRLLES